MIDVVMISLEAATERRAAFMADVAAQTVAPGIAHHLVATDAAVDQLPPGNARPAERACWMSHGRALSWAAGRPGPVLICEDDVRLFPRSLELIEQLAAKHTASLLYCECGIADTLDIARMFTLARRQRDARQVSTFDARRLPSLFGTAAYVVHPKLAARLADRLLAPGVRVDSPVDLTLREAIARGEVSAFVAAPFLTSLGPHADVSQVQAAGDPVKAATEDMLNAARRLVCLEPPVGLISGNLTRAEAAIGDLAASLLGRVIALRLSPRLYVK